MIEAEEYVRRVLDALPEEMADRDDIAMELRSHIMERMASGETLHDILADLGEPEALAETYLAEVPLESARFGARAGAKLIDLFALTLIFACLWLAGMAVLFTGPGVIGVAAMMVLGIVGTGLYVLIPAALEFTGGRTPGKRLFGLRVVQESGARISFGQAVVRQLPWILQIFWIDALFALFTPRKQRAFEMLSKTRVVVNEG